MHPTSEIVRRVRRPLPAPLATLAVLAVLAVAVPACAQQSGASATPSATSGDEVVATAAGQKITRAELEQGASDQLDQVDAQLRQCQLQANQSRYQALHSTLEDMVHQKLVAAEAAKAGESTDDYLASELENSIAPVTDEDVSSFFEQNRARIGNRTLEQIGPQIRQYLEQQRRQEAEGNFYKKLEAKYDVAYLLEPPRTEVAATGPARGPEDAPITIVEFSDFQCPFCSRVEPTLEQVMENYGDKVRLVFRQFPLNIHPNAQKAAEASLCARDQGKFWEMHDAMFADQKGLSVEGLKKKAAALGLDSTKFDQCLDSGQFADEVHADLQAGSEAGVNGTPAMFINGIPVSGAVPYENMAQVIDAELARKNATD